MKLQVSDLPISKPQARRKIPKLIGPLIALTVLCTIVPIYFPSLRFFQKKLSETSYYLNHVEDFDDQTTLFEPHTVSPKQEDDTTEVVDEQSSSNEPEALNKDIETERITSERREKDTESETEPEPETEPEESNLITTEKEIDKDFQTERTTSRKSKGGARSCDIFSGEWIPNPDGPYYTNLTCTAIQDHQNCMKYGRPDIGFTKWRWKPDGCELPIFEPRQFLELVRGKSLAFVGDSVARNNMQSLICLLSRVVYPLDISDNPNDNFKKWYYPDYDFNISSFWAPYLVKNERMDPNDVNRPHNLFLDEFDEVWRSQIERFDYVIISAGQWFFRPTFFYLNRKVVGCLYCNYPKMAQHLKPFFSYRRAFRTALKAIYSLEKFKGVVFLRTFAPSHFEGGPWDKGGDCVRTRPFMRNETVYDGDNLEMFNIQSQELEIAKRAGRKKGIKFRLFDATKSMLLRPDGHPSKYGHWPNANVVLYNDCVHWCLPGPIDAWSDFLLHMMKNETQD